MNFILLFSLLLITSCGTVTKRESYIQIDSNPRGVQVLDKNKEIIGVTPLTIETKVSRHNIFYTDSGMRKHDFKCSLDWKKSIIPNFLVAPISFPSGLVFTGLFSLTDYTLNNLYVCNKVFTVNELITINKKDKRPRVITLPLYEGNFYKVNEILKQIETQFENKYQFINYDQSLKLFSSLGINEERRWNYKSIKKRALNRITSDFDATYVAILNHIDSSNSIEVKIYDLYTGVQIPNNISLKMEKSEEVDTLKRYTKQYFHFFPNGITFGNNDSGYAYQDSDNANSLKFKRHPDNFHWFISSWSLSYVSNPHLFETWDYEFKFSPHASMPSLKAQASVNYSLLLRTYNLTYDFVATAHTAIGAFSFQIGPGLTHINSTDSNGNHISYKSVVMHSGLSYSAFISERFFIKGGIDIYSPTKNKIISRGEVISQFHNITINIGYFLPEFKSFFR